MHNIPDGKKNKKRVNKQQQRPDKHASLVIGRMRAILGLFMLEQIPSLNST